MKNEELFNKTVGILVNAYANNTLEAGNCMACAVGNLVAANTGMQYVKVEKANDLQYDRTVMWADKPYSAATPWYNILKNVWGNIPDDIKRIGEAQIESTGYTLNQLNMIERGFERGAEGGIFGKNANDSEAAQYGGLVGAYSVLLAIHEVDITKALKAEEVFVKPPVVCTTEKVVEVV